MEIGKREEMKTLVQRLRCSVDELPMEMGRVYGEIAAYMEEKGITTAGAPFAIYHNMDMQALEIEIGFPITGKAQGEGKIKAGAIPGGRTASHTHKGSYQKMEESYNKLISFVQERNEQAQEWTYEFYMNDPREVQEEELLTEIHFPLV